MIIIVMMKAYHTQKIVGGKDKKNQYSPKEYILAALNLYQDVIALFLSIMKFLHRSKYNDDDNNNKRKNYFL